MRIDIERPNRKWGITPQSIQLSKKRRESVKDAFESELKRNRLVSSDLLHVQITGSTARNQAKPEHDVDLLLVAKDSADRSQIDSFASRLISRCKAKDINLEPFVFHSLEELARDDIGVGIFFNPFFVSDSILHSKKDLHELRLKAADEIIQNHISGPELRKLVKDPKAELDLDRFMFPSIADGYEEKTEWLEDVYDNLWNYILRAFRKYNVHPDKQPLSDFLKRT